MRSQQHGCHFRRVGGLSIEVWKPGLEITAVCVGTTSCVLVRVLPCATLAVTGRPFPFFS